ncbi:MAG: AraC family transcriptional regulator [Spirochaetia bacterium]|nr:AraC family transcriptional regulator [Spirochaetia bacterium]
MLKSINNRYIIAISLIIIILSAAIISTGDRSKKYNRLITEAQTVMDSWNNLERIKNDFLVNRSNVTVLGAFDYKENVSNWENQIYDFQRIFSQLIRNAEKITITDFSRVNLQFLSFIWDSTQNKLMEIHELLKELEKSGLDDLLFPELISNYFTYRMTDKIDFNDNVNLMNLLNQFAFLDISSKEFYRLMNSYTNAVRQEQKTSSAILMVLSWIMLFMFILAILLVFFSFRQQIISKKQIDEYKRSARNNALKRFMKGLESWDNICPLITDIEYGKKTIPVLMKFSNYAIHENEIGPTEISWRLSSLSRYVENELKNHSLNCLLIPFEEGIAVFHFLSGILLSETNQERTVKLINCIKELINQKTNFSFSFTYGQEHLFPEETQKSFKKVYEASYYKILYGNEKIISTDEIEMRQKIVVSYPMQLEKPLVEQLKQGNIDKAKEVYTEIMTVLTQSNYSIIRNGINRVVVAITSALDTLEKYNNISNDLDMIDFTRRIYSMETLSEINESIFSLIDHVALELSQKQENYKNSQISQINEIIQKDFSNPNLSTDFISEQLKLSGAYLNRIFKHQTGASILETVNNKRLETARDLLLKENSTISEICKSVGILNDMHFYTLFKKRYGSTPKEYKQKHSI